uniref:Uncharacterized protein n=1 Tax=Brassica campestris TaxID=3711 RepID=A0A3P5ZEE1_BRACM|nr:unnamed protein product [Brassica rapa]
MWSAERKTVEEREGDERCGESSECCEGDGGYEAELGAGLTGYDGGRGLEEGRWSQGTVGMLRDSRALTCCGLWV